jgi:hypothetical protein
MKSRITSSFFCFSPLNSYCIYDKILSVPDAVGAEDAVPNVYVAAILVMVDAAVKEAKVDVLPVTVDAEVTVDVVVETPRLLRRR